MKRLIVATLAVIFSASALSNNNDVCLDGRYVKQGYILDISHCKHPDGTKTFQLDITLDEGTGDHFVIGYWDEQSYKTEVREGIKTFLFRIENYSGDHKFDAELAEKINE